MANHKSAIKRAKQNIIRRNRNRAVKTRVKNVIKQILTLVNQKSTEAAKDALPYAKSVIDRAAQKGVIHKNNAARKISRLTRLVNSIQA